MKSVTFILPSSGDKPTGGYKVAYEYANRLVGDGYKVNIVYAGSIFWKKKTIYFKITNCVRFFQSIINGYSCCRWFKLDKRVKEHLALSMNYCHLPKSDIYIASSPYTAMYVNDYPIDCSRKFYMIQDYENWGNVTDEILRQTYHYQLRKIVISNWLFEIMQQEGVESELIPNGFDFNYFKLNIPIEEKDKFRVTMLYHSMERKGCKYGFEALEMVKRRYPQLRINLFGTPERPVTLPDWYDYYQCPDKDTHNRIYNEAAIYLGPSVIEGWGLTIGEAMICGQAVVCTDNLGYREMAVDEETALIAPVKDANQLAENIIRLVEDDTLRKVIAEKGRQYIKRFSWDSSYKRLVELFNTCKL